ncbi:hypothetical protein [Herbidospora mongoliensis]|uniref:hypothetical protein n=1 Tax=Herbidospora mongoliensis TaxID=688067 RepID=UPI00082FE6F7|nr:hypothetical protein [Herbidospora mongoliensis]
MGCRAGLRQVLSLTPDPVGRGDESSYDLVRRAPADSQRKYASTTYVYAAREFFATGKGFLDAVVLKSEPRFLGPYETALDTALAKRS